MLDLNSTIGRYFGGRIPPQGLAARGGETPVLHRVPPHLQPSLAALTLGAGGQPGSEQAAVVGALPPCSPGDECPAALRFSPGFGEKPRGGRWGDSTMLQSTTTSRGAASLLARCKEGTSGQEE